MSIITLTRPTQLKKLIHTAWEELLSQEFKIPRDSVVAPTRENVRWFYSEIWHKIYLINLLKIRDTLTDEERVSLDSFCRKMTKKDKPEDIKRDLDLFLEPSILLFLQSCEKFLGDCIWISEGLKAGYFSSVLVETNPFSIFMCEGGKGPLPADWNPLADAIKDYVLSDKDNLEDIQTIFLKKKGGK
jgi:hypothetical protein